MTSVPDNELARIDALCGLNLLDTPPEERFDRITRTAARFFEVPIVLVSLIDSERQWFKSNHGLPATETPRSTAFCAHAILQDKMLIVEDAQQDPRFKDNPLVIGEPFIRFYAGQPIYSQDGFALGTLCLIDQKPRGLSAAEIVALRDFASMVDDQLSKETMARHALSRTKQLHDSEARFVATFEQAAVGIAHIGIDGAWLKVNRKVPEILGYAQAEFEELPLRSITFPEDLAPWQARNAELFDGTRASYSLEMRYLHKAGYAVWVNLNVTLIRGLDARPDYFVAVIEDIQEKKRAQNALHCLNEELETRIELRTAELRQKNDELAKEIQHRQWVENVLRTSETRIRTILDNSNDAFIGIDSDGIIIDWNKSAETTFGWSRDDALGKALTSTIIPLKHQWAHHEGMQRFLNSDAKSTLRRRMEIPARTRSGMEIPVEMTISAYQIDGNYQFAAFLHDVSERRAILQNL